MGDNSWNGREQNHALVNVGGGRFEEVGTPWGLDDTRDARGLAAADFDRDGDVDFVVNNYRAEASYFLNDLASERGFVAVRLEGVRCARDAIGAEVAVVVGGRRQVKLLSAGSGYAGQTSKELLFGLGGAAAVESGTTHATAVALTNRAGDGAALPTLHCRCTDSWKPEPVTSTRPPPAAAATAGVTAETASKP